MKKDKKEKKEKKPLGDRIMQIVLLGLIALGIFTIPAMVGGGPGAGSGGPGGMPGGGMPGGDMPAMAGEEGDTKAVAVDAAEVGLSMIREYIRVNGDVSPTASVNLYPDVSGEIVSVPVTIGDTVYKGQTIAVVDPSLPGQIYSTSKMDTTISGTVTALNYDIGETVTTSTAIATVGNLNELEIVTYVPERYSDSIHTGLKAETMFDAFSDETFTATVTEVNPVLDTSSRTVKVTLSLDGSDRRIKVGMFASIRLIIKEEADVVSVPASALTKNYEQNVVYVVEDGIARMQEVEVGLTSDENVQITEGLSLGEKVITRGLSGVVDGSSVRIVN